MDLTTFDVTERPGCRSRHLAGDASARRRPPDDLAAAAGTNGYEVLTSLGRRFHRIYPPA